VVTWQRCVWLLGSGLSKGPGASISRLAAVVRHAFRSKRFLANERLVTHCVTKFTLSITLSSYNNHCLESKIRHGQNR
jgi:hypothetical protein